MDDTTKHDPDAGFEPAFAAPPNACDAHFHVFGPAEKYALRHRHPLQAAVRAGRDLSRSWRGASASCVTYSFSRAPTASTIPACSMPCAQLDPAVRRGIIDLDENNTSDKELSDLERTRRARHPRQHLADPQAGGRPRRLDAAAHRPARQDLRGARLAPRLPDAGLAGQRIDADAARIAGRIFGRAYGPVSRQRRAGAAGLPGIPRAGRRRFETLLGQADRHLPLLDRAGFRRRETDRAGADGRGAGPIDLGQRLSASVVPRPRRHHPALQSARRMGAGRRRCASAFSPTIRRGCSGSGKSITAATPEERREQTRIRHRSRCASGAGTAGFRRSLEHQARQAIWPALPAANGDGRSQADRGACAQASASTVSASAGRPWAVRVRSTTDC